MKSGVGGIGNPSNFAVLAAIAWCTHVFRGDAEENVEQRPVEILSSTCLKVV